MSTDAEFSTLTYPALRNQRQDDRDDRARAGGHAAGYAAGLRAAEAEVAARIAQLDAEHAAVVSHARARTDRAVALLAAACAALDSRTVPVLETAHAILAEGAIQLAEAVVASEFSDVGTAAASALHRALATVDASGVHVVRLNPDDLGVLDADLLAATGVTFVPDPSLGRGDAVTEFADGYLDCRVSSAIERARTAIAEARS
ncbi:flagellar assembly protein FliH [Conyzicola lurida]|uniref:Flagellar assembly protein FliH n=1 Tax=Conyzicola lurida TaxID=1172621 RepID=A0A841ATP6_9MICO|nr:FliH/SctL family protein [Conyzicola lurida]MBB5845161.1 flagellar assembly protein FliH [Conyzicola lurida]